MSIEELTKILQGYENKELPVTVTGNNSFGVDITDTIITENGNTLLLYENSYLTKTGKHLLSSVKTISDLLEILDIIKDKSMQIKGRGTNGMLVSPNECRICYVDNYTMLDLYNKTKPMTIEKAKQDAQEFIKNLHND